MQERYRAKASDIRSDPVTNTALTYLLRLICVIFDTSLHLFLFESHKKSDFVDLGV